MNIRSSSTQQNDPEAGGCLNLAFLSNNNKSEEMLRWELIRKVYAILSLQMLLTVAVSASAVFFPTPVYLFTYTPAGIALFVFLVILIFMVIPPLLYYRKNEPYNFILLGVFTVSISFAVGFVCTFIDGKVILESAILTTVVLVGLTIYTFLAVDRVQDFTFLGPYLFAGSMIIILFAAIQILFPMGKILPMIYGGLASLVFSAYIIYDTAKMIKSYQNEHYVWVCVMLYLDVIGLFYTFINLFKRSDNN